MQMEVEKEAESTSLNVSAEMAQTRKLRIQAQNSRVSKNTAKHQKKGA